MATQIQRRRGTTAQHASFTGALGELTVDTTKKTVVVHDGVTPGGFPLALASAVTGFTGGSLTSAINEAKGAAVASAGTCDIWTPGDGNFLHITGTTTITSFGTAPQAGAERVVIFDGALTLTHNATTLKLPGGTNITTAANDRAIVRADTTANMIVVSYQKADGTAVVASGSSGALVFIGSQTASGSTSLDFTTGIDSTYDTYLFIGEDIVPATDNVQMYVRVSENAGGAWKAGGSDYYSGGTLGSEINSGGSIGSGANDSFSFSLPLYKPSGATRHKVFGGKGLGGGAAWRAAGVSVGEITIRGAYVGTANAINGVRFIMSSGNITSGTIRLYGVKKS